MPEYLALLIGLAVAVAMVSAALVLSALIGPRGRTSKNKQLPFECGQVPFESPGKPFPVHYYLVAILFLVFDIEVDLPLSLGRLVRRGRPLRVPRRDDLPAGAHFRPGLRVAPGRAGMALRGLLGGESFLTTRLDEAVGWARKYSIFQYPFVTACCGMEYMAAGVLALRRRPLRRGVPALLPAPGRRAVRGRHDQPQDGARAASASTTR